MQRTGLYCSTRGGESVGFEDAILNGLADDGGLFVPAFDCADIHKQVSGARSIADTASVWLGGLLREDPTVFESLYPYDVPLVRLSGGPYDGLHVLELFHGPTLSFKDFGARFLGHVLNSVLTDRGSYRIVLAATSGDTGSAVADALCGMERVRVVLLYPFGLISDVQERQLVAARPGVKVLAVDGSFDDCQQLVKTAFGSGRSTELKLTTANSINIGRLLPQQVYYSWAASQLANSEHVAVVPSGNLGNLSAGILAQKGGVPVGHFVAAHNSNDWFVRYLAGELDEFPETKATVSNAMDVGAPSNVERLRFWHDLPELSQLVSAYSASDDQTVKTMRVVREQTGYLADPHTSVGLDIALRYRNETGDDRPIVVLGTAHPAKFPETVRSATGEEIAEPENLRRLHSMRTDRSLVSADPSAVLEVLSHQMTLFG